MNRPRCRMGTALRLTQNLGVQDVAWHQADLPRAAYYTRDTRILDWRNTCFSVSPNSKFCIVCTPSVLYYLDSISSVLPGLHLLCVAGTPSVLYCLDSICPVIPGLHLLCIAWIPSALYCLDSKADGRGNANPMVILFSPFLLVCHSHLLNLSFMVFIKVFYCGDICPKYSSVDFPQQPVESPF